MIVSSVIQAVCDDGVVGAMPSLWVVVAVSGRRTGYLFIPLHVSNCTLDFRIGVMTPRWVLLWWDLSRFHDGCTKVTGSPIELLRQWWVAGHSPGGYLTPAAYSNPVEPGSVFSLYLGLPLTRR